MTVQFEFDIADIESAAHGHLLVQATDLLGRYEYVFGSTDHVFRRAADAFLHIQNYKIKEPYAYTIVRRNLLTVQFVVTGGYKQKAGSQLVDVFPGTIRISGLARSETHVPKQDFLGVGIYVFPQQLAEVFGLQVDNVPDLYRPLFNSPPSAAPVMELPMPGVAWAVVQEIASCKFPEPMRREYLSAKTAELICYAVAEVNKLRRAAPIIAVARSTRERAKIEMAAEIYRREVSNPPSLDEVAMRVGLNRNKLVGGFREVHNMTPTDFSRQLRLRRAHEMLLNPVLPVQRIAAATGYSTHAAFTRSFKDEFGYAPSEAAARTGGGDLPPALHGPSVHAA